MIEKCAVWRDLCEGKKLLCSSLSPSVYMEINFNSILGTELIPSSRYRVDTGAISFSHFVRIKIFSHERQIWLKYTFGLGWWIPERLCGRVCVGMLRWYWKGIWGLFRLCSWHVPSLLLPRWNPLSSGMTAGSAALFKQPQIWRGSEWNDGKNNFEILPSHAKLSSVSKVVFFFFNQTL